MNPAACPITIRGRRPGMLPFLLALVVWLSLTVISRGLKAQTFDATNLREPRELAATWLVHAGDDPAFARLDFDDSQWMKFDSTKDLRDLFPRSHPEIVWYRLRVKVAADQTDLAMLEQNIDTAFEIYSNGKPLLKLGQVAPFVAYVPSTKFLVPFPRDQLATGYVVIALRVHITPYEWSLGFPGYDNTTLTVGQYSTLREHMWFTIIGERAFPWLNQLARLAMCAGALLLFLTQRERDEYIWLMLLVLCEVPNWIVGLFSLTHACPESWLRICQFVSLPYIYFFVRMYCSFVGHRVGWMLQIYTIATLILYGGYFYTGDRLLYPQPGLMFLAIWTPFVILTSVVLPAIMIKRIRLGKRVEAVLLVPVLLADFTFVTGWFGNLVLLIPALGAKANAIFSPMLYFHVGPFSVSLITIAEILEMISLALIILIRSNRVSRQQTVLTAEIANAREVQQVIVPEQIESIPGFTIESVYQPAQKVGGDFFQIIPDRDGGLLIVVGDVAGKGLPAAMLVSVLVGAIRATAEFTNDPAELLGHLNERLLGRTKGGFSTTLAAHITAEGVVSIANAGHLPPYLDGREVELPGALPLGILKGASYEAERLSLAVGSRLTFYTDGVVEAQNQKGELFGFERGRSISTLPAAAIVEEAKLFGQSDDITVVTVERNAAVDEAASLRTSPILAATLESMASEPPA